MAEEENVYHLFHDRLRRAEDSLRDKPAPTFPIYDMTNPPQDAIEGQVAINANDDTLWWYSNGSWHTGAVATKSPAFAHLYVDSLSQGDTAYSVPGNTNKYCQFLNAAHRQISDSSVFAVETFVNPFDKLTINKDFNHGGIYLAFANVQYDVGGNESAIVYNGGLEDMTPHMSWGQTSPFDSGWSFTSGRGIPTNQDYSMFWVYDGAQANIRLLLQNTNVSARAARLAYLNVIYIPVTNVDNTTFL